MNGESRQIVSRKRLFATFGSPRTASTEIPRERTARLGLALVSEFNP